MALRFANVIFEALWNNRYIDNIQITVAETLGVGDRASYYDNYGAIRDMLQNHLLQCFVWWRWNRQHDFNADQVRNEKLRVLQALRPVNAENVVLGQYQDYPHEVGATTSTETYVALKVLIDNWRWAGVPFYIRTGKKLKTRASEIVITFKDRPHDIFTSDGITDREAEIPNRLIIRVQPHEGLRLLLTSKEPGPGGMRLFPSELNLSFGETFNERLPEAYERLLMDIARATKLCSCALMRCSPRGSSSTHLSIWSPNASLWYTAQERWGLTMTCLQRMGGIGQTRKRAHDANR